MAIIDGTMCTYRVSEQAKEVDRRVGIKRRLRNLSDDFQRRLPAVSLVSLILLSVQHVASNNAKVAPEGTCLKFLC